MASNQHPSIAFTLPSELLIQICQVFLRTINTQTQYCRRDIRNPDVEILQPIVSVSQVCRDWRDIVTQCPELWCHFINPHHSNPEWTQLLLERSKPYGITLYKTPPRFMGHEDEPKFFKEVAYADRLISYSVALDMYCGIWRDRAIPLHWPQLRYLCIAHLQYYEVGSVFHPQMHTHLLMPAGFPSSESTPMLERLHLHKCALLFVSQITGLSNLKELSISGNRVWPVLQWVEILQSLHHLEILSLENIIAEPGDTTGALGTRNYSKANHMLTIQLERFLLQDECRLCAQFFECITFTISKVFELGCYNAEGTYNEFGYSSFICQRITPTIRNLLTTNPHFSNCALYIIKGVIGCFGVPNNALGKFELPGRMKPSEAFIGVEFDVPLEHQSQHARMVKEWLSPILENVIDLNIADDEDIILEDDGLFSELLWKSSFRLRGIHGTTFNAWRIMFQNMFPEHQGFEPPCPSLPTVPFLYALEEIGMLFNHAPEGYPLYQNILKFCNHKRAMGRPLMRLNDPPPIFEAESDPDRAAFIRELEALGVQVNETPYSDIEVDV